MLPEHHSFAVNSQVWWKNDRAEQGQSPENWTIEAAESGLREGKLSDSAASIAQDRPSGSQLGSRVCKGTEKLQLSSECVLLFFRIIRTKVQQPFHPTPDGSGTGVTAPGHTIGKKIGMRGGDRTSGNEDDA